MKGDTIFRISLTALLAGLGSLLAATGGAEQKTGVIHVSTQAVSSCVVMTEALEFDRNLRLRERHAVEDDDDDEHETRSRGGNGGNTGTENFNWRIRVRCNRDQVYLLAADRGEHFSSGIRHMTNDRGNLVAYRLFKQGRSGDEWGDRDFGDTYVSGSSIAGTGNGRWKTHVIHGRLLRPPRFPSGALSDKVRVSMHH